MKEITLFYLTECPYCRNARRALKELTEEQPAYAGVQLHWVEESLRPDIADLYDYYYVPSAFQGKKKLYEAEPGERYEATKEYLRQALDQVLGGGE